MCCKTMCCKTMSLFISYLISQYDLCVECARVEIEKAGSVNILDKEEWKQHWTIMHATDHCIDRPTRATNDSSWIKGDRLSEGPSLMR